MISVCIPVYNASRYLRECIDSILSQSYPYFELLIVDDGSTDNSREIVRSYNDPRIRLIENRHDYIGSLNILLKEARGKYIARMDADDRMIPNRLQVQIEYMERHPDIDIIGCGMRCFGEAEYECQSYRPGEIGYLDFIECCALYHPTIMMRRDSIISAEITYRQEYIYAEDYGFWAEAISKRLRIANLPDILLEYRLNPFQISYTKRTEQGKHSATIKSKLIKEWTGVVEDYLNEKSKIPSSSNKLTTVIPFYNEGIELLNTVKSIRKTAKDTVDIIVVNDHSDDGINYKEMLEGLGVYFVENPYRMGPGVSKEKGVQYCATPFFILLDAHMRFYQDNWVDLILNELESNPRQITCCKTKALKKINGIVEEKETSSTYGAFVYLGIKQYMPMAVWNPNPNIQALRNGNALCILGATYASSKEYWNYIKGFRGLLGYGCEEAFVSLKAWLEGGKCKFISDVTIGHIYKDESNYSSITPCYIYNFLFIAHLLFPTSLMCKTEAIAHHLDPNQYKHAIVLLRATQKWRKLLKEALAPRLNSCDMEYLKHINYVVHPDSMADITKRMSIFPDVLSFCESQELPRHEIGLMNGKTALLLLYIIYFRSEQQETKWRYKAHSELSDIRQYITQSSECLLSFADGLAGVGWGLIYLLDNNLLQAEEAHPLLEMIDKRIATVSPNRMLDSSIGYGYTGIAAYVTARLGYCMRNNVSHELRTDFIEELKSVCRDNISYNQPSDIYAYSINRLMSLYGCQDWSTLRTDLTDIIKLPTSIIKNQKHWRINLQTGCVGYALHLLTTKYHVDQNQ